MGIEPTSEAWEAWNKILKAIDLAAVKRFGLALLGNWMETDASPWRTQNARNSAAGRMLIITRVLGWVAIVLSGPGWLGAFRHAKSLKS